MWSAREDRIIMMIVNHFLRDKDFILAIKLYNKVLNKRPKDVNLLSGLGRIFVQMGNIHAAEVVFNQVEQLTQHTDSSTLVHMNRYVGYWKYYRDILLMAWLEDFWPSVKTRLTKRQNTSKKCCRLNQTTC